MLEFLAALDAPAPVARYRSCALWTPDRFPTDDVVLPAHRAHIPRLSHDRLALHARAPRASGTHGWSLTGPVPVPPEHGDDARDAPNRRTEPRSPCTDQRPRSAQFDRRLGQGRSR